MNLRLGAFIMTYDRPLILIETIRLLMLQTRAPDYILVVDNSPGIETRRAVAELSTVKVGYHSMGYNAGPAGAAKFGLLKLTELGFDWILWGDDDDPPAYPGSIERIFGTIEKYQLRPQEIGILGLLGGKLNTSTGRTVNFENRELNGVVDADYIPGNKLMIINRAVAERNILPSAELFFGFEELDFCLKVKRGGFRVVFDGDAMLQSRRSRGRIEASYRWSAQSSLGDSSKLWRQYYSTRNLLFVLKRNGHFLAVGFVLSKTIIKSIYGYRFGFRYGTRQFVSLWKAMFHFFFGITGKKVSPQGK